MSVQGRFCVILFYFMQCETEAEDTEVLNFTLKLVPHGGGYDDDDDDIDHQPGGSAS